MLESCLYPIVRLWRAKRRLESESGSVNERLMIFGALLFLILLGVLGIRSVVAPELPQYAMPETVRVRSGQFVMGDEVGDLWFGCRPTHPVTLTYDYLIGRYEVTFAEYDEYAAATGAIAPYDQAWGREDRPVIYVDWWAAIHYCNWLSNVAGLQPAYGPEGELLDHNGEVTTDITKVEGYRLPTEAEWEYAASGGHESLPLPGRFLYSGSDEIDAVAWYSGNSGEYIYDPGSGFMDFRNHGIDHIKGMSSQPVGQKAANGLGIHDMSGNVWEWCHDWYGDYTADEKVNPIGAPSGHVRVMRGGSWIFGAGDCRVASRFYRSAHDKLPRLGFRVARTLPSHSNR